MTHTLHLRVYYEDVDFAGIVYYANYLKFLERGRTEALRARGIDQVALKARGLVFAVTRVEIDYRRSARFDDLLTVETETVRVGGASVVMTQSVKRGEELLAPAKVWTACISLDGHACRLPPDIRARLLAGAAQAD